MNESSLLQSLGQVPLSDAANVFRDHLRGAVRQMITDVMAQEVNELCGAKHHPTDGDTFRNGSTPGRVIYEGQREEVVRPRVRQRQANGSTREIQLASYQAASCPEQLRGVDHYSDGGRGQYSRSRQSPRTWRSWSR